MVNLMRTSGIIQTKIKKKYLDIYVFNSNIFE